MHLVSRWIAVWAAGSASGQLLFGWVPVGLAVLALVLWSARRLHQVHVRTTGSSPRRELPRRNWPGQ